MISKYTFLLVFIFAISCKSKKSTKTNPETTVEYKKMIEDGFEKGVIIASDKDRDCPYVIEIKGEKNPIYLDPLDLPEEYKKDGVAIWFKYMPSRRPNRCDKANPVTLNNSVLKAD